MAKMKSICIEARLDEKFKVAVTAGDRTIYVDQPKFAGGTDAGPNPMEFFFTSLAGCIATTARIVANQKNIKLNGMDIKIEGVFDTDILLGRSEEGRPGMTDINVILNIDSNASNEDFIKEIRARCPVSDNIVNVTPVTIQAL
ncbi:OsmC family protein [Geotalea toluenoxydans]|uniref:OsmC family protein n=1 Tax=Geotalea toluenoxydans TaxID=421624 RepID=UPI0006D1A8EE|nr:OsmC family protein [Geotalea toluenoxydans]